METAEQLYRNEKIDIVHSFWLNEPLKAGKKIADTLHVPIVATAMGQEMRNSKNRLKWLISSSIPIVSLSQFQLKELQKIHLEVSKIINWGVKERMQHKKEIDLICVGNLVPLKNINYFVELCAALIEDNPELTAKIVGTGPLLKSLRDKIVLLDLNKNIELMGLVDYNVTQDLIAKSKVLVHPSEFEGFGMTIIEALASGTHVISNPVGIAEELDILHLTSNVSEDAVMIQNLLDKRTPEPRLFDIRSTVDKYFKLYGF